MREIFFDEILLLLDPLATDIVVSEVDNGLASYLLPVAGVTVYFESWISPGFGNAPPSQAQVDAIVATDPQFPVDPADVSLVEIVERVVALEGGGPIGTFPSGVFFSHNTDDTTNINQETFIADTPLTGDVVFLDPVEYEVVSDGQVRCLLGGFFEISSSVYHMSSAQRVTIESMVHVDGIAVGGIGGPGYVRNTGASTDKSGIPGMPQPVAVPANGVVSVRVRRENASSTGGAFLTAGTSHLYIRKLS